MASEIQNISTMNRDEIIAEIFLKTRFQNIIFEPDGNVTPDFLINDEIAVEVRKLNQNFTFKDGTVKGLEQDEFTLWKRFDKLVAEFGPATDDRSWFVFFDFQRPVDKWKNLAPKITEVLKNVQILKPNQFVTFKISTNLNIDIIPASKKHETAFLMGGLSDNNSGGFILAELEKNLRLVIEEKTKKTAQYRSKYKQWWLVLPNYISYFLDPIEHKQFVDTLNIEHSWHKIILINPFNIDSFFEI